MLVKNKHCIIGWTSTVYQEYLLSRRSATWVHTATYELPCGTGKIDRRVQNDDGTYFKPYADSFLPANATSGRARARLCPSSTRARPDLPSRENVEYENPAGKPEQVSDVPRPHVLLLGRSARCCGVLARETVPSSGTSGMGRLGRGLANWAGPVRSGRSFFRKIFFQTNKTNKTNKNKILYRHIIYQNF